MPSCHFPSILLLFIALLAGSAWAEKPKTRVEKKPKPPVATPTSKGKGTPQSRKENPAQNVPRGPVGKVPTEVGLENAKFEKLPLGGAIQEALSNNLQARISRSSWLAEREQIRFQAGAFDPVFSINGSRESIQSPQNTANINSPEALLSLQGTIAQIDAINAQSAALNSQALAIDRNALAVNNLAIALRDRTDAAREINNLPPLANPQPFEPIPGDFTLIDPPRPSEQSFLNLQQSLTGRTIVFDQDADRVEASLGFRTPIGTRFAFTAREARIRSTFDGDLRDINPFYTAFGGIQLRQPLLRDFGTDANLRQLREARIAERIARTEWRRSVNESVATVLSTYHDMIFGLENLNLLHNTVKSGLQIVQQNTRRVEVGFGSAFDVQQSMARVSEDREEMLRAKNVFMTSQFNMKRLIRHEYETGDTTVLLPEILPVPNVAEIDRTQLIRRAFSLRPEYQAELIRAELGDIRLAFAKNQALPQLDLVATYGFNGLGFSESNARRATYHSQAPEWTIALQFSVPLGNRQGSANVATALAVKEQLILRLKQVELAVSVDVDTAISLVETEKQRVKTAAETRALNEEAVRIVYRSFEEGQASTFDLLEQRRNLGEARSRELEARNGLAKAITRLWLATGEILDQLDVEIDDLPPLKQDRAATRR